MTQAEFNAYIQEKGHIAVSCLLLEKYQAMDITPEELGSLLLALYRQRLDAAGGAGQGRDEPYPGEEGRGADPWIGWALEKGWARWIGEGRERRADFEPLWRKLYQIWEEEREADERAKAPHPTAEGGFDYSRIVKELDRLRGSLSVTVREQQLIQEFNLKYGWSSDFIINFFRLCSQRNLIQIKNYKPLAAQIHRAGVYTLEGLASFMSEVDWISKQAAELKKDYLGLYNMVTVMEREYYVKWHITWRYSHALIVRAARESVGAANATFKYIDSIIGRWHELGAEDMEACEEAIRLWNEEKKTQAAARGSGQAQGKASRRKGDKERGSSVWSGFLDEGGDGL
ncbi:MAG: DnaD domain protein [Clostridiales bacterium]|nr:DnaD domain protein [Clostridiales bacterium]